MELEHKSQCSCGAVSIIIEGEGYSMPRKRFNDLFGRHRITNKTFCCDYCVNNWGIDLCHCGSGEKVDECDNGFPTCGTPAQTLGEKREVFSWA